ncbi:Fe(3+)-citrate-binding protein YfmC precursor [Actinomadura rubteroloni]|uniref:Fe(3+)-citrate-binding protein YfmC n=1 Tax=Actinomadura rubteroloni TaxID=1926885 RepID=A0A2P4UEF4_9ACTN|nr:ABC transporter substrate-binding protein [Actinomadura rubteroloni]POM23416.1 Fe(3+)-citrate-binding protein YfmC precursor [Actinomadura rubteroloni]
MSSARALGALVLTGVLALASACGGDDGKADAKGQSVVVTAANGAVRVPAAPKRIVSLSPTHTETLFAIGAGPQVVAADEYSNYPANAPRTKLSGFKPNVEAITKYNPDLVVVSDDINGIVKALEKVKVPVLLEPAAKKIDDVYDEIGDLGLATGRSGAAAKLTATMRAEIQKTVAAAPKKNLTYYHELDDQLHTVTSSTFIGQVYGLFGLRNIADPADKTRSGYPQLSREALLTSDPDLVFLADTKCCAQSAAQVAKRPGWSRLTAVRAGGVVALDDDVASRWGPRLPQFAATIGAAVGKVAAGK